MKLTLRCEFLHGNISLEPISSTHQWLGLACSLDFVVAFIHNSPFVCVGSWCYEAVYLQALLFSLFSLFSLYLFFVF